MVSAKYLEEYFSFPHQIWYTEAPGQDEDLVWTGWPWPYFCDHRGHLRWWDKKDYFHSILEQIFDVSSHFRCHRGHLRQRDIKDGLRWISEEIIYVSSPNLEHRSTRARWRQSLNWVALTLFSRSQRSFRQQDMKDCFRRISKEIFDVSSPNLVHRCT